MCTVRVKKDIKNKQDVYFLVGSVINRQTRPFSIEDITNIVWRNLYGSPVKPSKPELYSIINHEIDILYRNNYLKMSGKKYVNNDGFMFFV